MKRMKCDDDLYIIHYDFSDEMNLIHIEDVKHKIGYKENLGLCIFDNKVCNVFQPVVGERVFTMRLLVAQDLLNFPFNGKINVHKLKSKNDKCALFFYDHIDSESKIIMNDLKNMSFTEPAFEIYFRGIVLRLIANFIDRYSNMESPLDHISDKEINIIDHTKDFLLDNLTNKFPGVKLLANMAGMSVTKYKLLFKKMFADTPSSFFNKQKMCMAEKLLKSGKFDSVTDVRKHFKFNNKGTFTAKYYKQFGIKPSEDLKR